VDTLNYPPSLDADVLARCFVAHNRELGVLPGDVAAFVEACRRDGLAILGWELWLVDVAQSGSWTGLIPCKGDDHPSVVSGSIDGEPVGEWTHYVDRSAEEAIAQIARFSLDTVADEYAESIRYNFAFTRGGR
jgi:hypothetical protein